MMMASFFPTHKKSPSLHFVDLTVMPPLKFPTIEPLTKMSRSLTYTVVSFVVSTVPLAVTITVGSRDFQTVFCSPGVEAPRSLLFTSTRDVVPLFFLDLSFEVKGTYRKSVDAIMVVCTIVCVGTKLFPSFNFLTLLGPFCVQFFKFRRVWMPFIFRSPTGNSQRRSVKFSAANKPFSLVSYLELLLVRTLVHLTVSECKTYVDSMRFAFCPSARVSRL